MTRIGIRGQLLLVVFLTVAASIVALVIGFNLILARTLDRDARALVRSRVNAERALITTGHGHVSVADAPNDAAQDANIWVFSNGRSVEQPGPNPIVDSAARKLQTGPSRFIDVASADVRLYSEPILFSGRTIGTIVGGLSLAPYEQTRRITLIASLVFAGVILALVVVAARWLLSSSLRPVRRMTRQAANWSEHDLEHRFALGEPHDELTELAATLDALLDRIAASLRHEQRFSAELSHELRTPLARVIAESDVALRRDRDSSDYRRALQSINKDAGQLARILDTLVAAARYQASSTPGVADAREVAEEVIEALRQLSHDRNVSIKLIPREPPVRLGVEADLAARILQPVVENAIRYCDHETTISISRTPTAIRFTIDDDGPGIADGERERIFEPGTRGQASGAWSSGSGLGLSLARRLAEAADGEINALPAAHGGSIAIDLPAG